VAEPGDGDHRTVRYRLMPERLLPFIAQLTTLAATEAEALPGTEPAPSLFAPWAAAGDPAFIVDREYHIRLWNSAAERYFGYQPQHVLGKPCTEVIQGCDPAGRRVCTIPCRPLLRLAAGASPPAFPLAVRAADGTPRPCVMSVIPLPGGWVAHLLHGGERVHQLERFLDQLQALLRSLDGAPRPSVAASPTPAPVRLTPREQEVLALLAQGARTEDLMHRLVVTRSTARKHVQSLLRKLGARNRLEAVSIARRRGLLA
jgi:DNA-binding CsgD family transcriptional regulator/PAS domain-containing protein